MSHPNLDPRISKMIESQIMYRDMHVGEILIISAEDAVTSKQAEFYIRVISIRQTENGHEATFILETGEFNFWLPKQKGTRKLKLGTYMEAGISAILLPRFVMRMVGIGGIECSGRDYMFNCVDGEYVNQVVMHNVTSIMSYYDEGEDYQPPDISEHLVKIERTKQECEESLVTDLPEIIILPKDNPDRVEQLKSKLKEYEGRKDVFKHSQQQSGTYCKIAVLDRLLEAGTLNPTEFREEVKNEPWFTSERFNAACWVIDDYCLTGGQKINEKLLKN